MNLQKCTDCYNKITSQPVLMHSYSRDNQNSMLSCVNNSQQRRTLNVCHTMLSKMNLSDRRKIGDLSCVDSCKILYTKDSKKNTRR